MSEFDRVELMLSDTLLSLRGGDVRQVVKIPLSADLIRLTRLCKHLEMARMSLHVVNWVFI